MTLRLEYVGMNGRAIVYESVKFRRVGDEIRTDSQHRARFVSTKRVHIPAVIDAKTGKPVGHEHRVFGGRVSGGKVEA